MRPRIVVLDEMTSARGPELGAYVFDMIRELAEGGRTMLIAKHQTEPVRLR